MKTPIPDRIVDMLNRRKVWRTAKILQTENNHPTEGIDAMGHLIDRVEELHGLDRQEIIEIIETLDREHSFGRVPTDAPSIQNIKTQDEGRILYEGWPFWAELLSSWKVLQIVIGIILIILGIVIERYVL